MQNCVQIIEWISVIKDSQSIEVLHQKGAS